MENKVELTVLHISNSQAQVGAYAMILEEVEGNRQLPIIIGPAEAQATALYLKGIHPPRPLTHDLFATTVSALGSELLRIYIYKAIEGVFYSYIYLKKENDIFRIDARTSDAVALALRLNAPIFISETLLEKECIRMEEERIQDPEEESMSLEALKEALEKAVKEENYELASVLRDKILQKK